MTKFNPEYKLSNVAANILGPDSRLLQNEGIIEDNIGQRKSMKRISPLKSSNHLFDRFCVNLTYFLCKDSIHNTFSVTMIITNHTDKCGIMQPHG